MVDLSKDEIDCRELKEWVEKEYKGRGFFGVRPAPDGTPYIIEYGYNRKLFERDASQGTKKGPQPINYWF